MHAVTLGPDDRQAQHDYRPCMTKPRPVTDMCWRFFHHDVRLGLVAFTTMSLAGGQLSCNTVEGLSQEA